MKYFLDTCTISILFEDIDKISNLYEREKREEYIQKIKEKIELNSNDIFSSFLCKGESMYGFQRIVNMEKVSPNKSNAKKISMFQKILDFYDSIKLLSIEKDTLIHYSNIAESIREKFNHDKVKKDIHDIWIAAICIQNDLTLITADKRSFPEMKQLKYTLIEDWIS